MIKYHCSLWEPVLAEMLTLLPLGLWEACVSCTFRFMSECFLQGVGILFLVFSFREMLAVFCKEYCLPYIFARLDMPYGKMLEERNSPSAQIQKHHLVKLVQKWSEVCCLIGRYALSMGRMVQILVSQPLVVNSAAAEKAGCKAWLVCSGKSRVNLLKVCECKSTYLAFLTMWSR